MLAQKIKEKMKRGEPSLGSWMSMAHPSIAEILAMAGYDWVVIETEHTAIDVSEVLRLIISIEQRGAVPLVRLAWNDPIQAKAVLDSGAAGVLVPMVNSKADAELAVQMTRYPPLGSRGVGLARAQGYGENFDAYVKSANDDTLLIVQIEHKEAVANIEEILSVPGIDGTFIGPYDLSMSLGIPGQTTHPLVLEAKRKVLKSTLSHGLISGVHFVQPRTAAADCRQAVSEGYRFIALGTDILFLGDSARALKNELESVG
ncbi:MAG: 2,4-dihydroxyhept-2-ene-1,7-dioic acid aldolase [Desulfobacteraceae bacterium]|nr:MAG: 2,4-dihydroxyhept-2-ene-1,7-dioic acid aldolase [Desulfobacteraceae bacterium]